jgi:hypothetical protein
MTDFSKRIFVAATAGALTLAQTAGALALPAAPLADAGADVTQIRAGYHGGGFHGGGAGWHRPPNAVHPIHRPPVYRPPVHRPPAYRPPYGHWHGHYHGAWVRPVYGWRPGGAIAAGAAIGFLTAATAAAYASSTAPAPGLCWYYTDASRRAGFWDYCP